MSKSWSKAERQLRILKQHIRNMKKGADEEGLYLGLGKNLRVLRPQEGPMVKRLYALAGIKGYELKG